MTASSATSRSNDKKRLSKDRSAQGFWPGFMVMLHLEKNESKIHAGVSGLILEKGFYDLKLYAMILFLSMFESGTLQNECTVSIFEKEPL